MNCTDYRYTILLHTTGPYHSINPMKNAIRINAAMIIMLVVSINSREMPVGISLALAVLVDPADTVSAIANFLKRLDSSWREQNSKVSGIPYQLIFKHGPESFLWTVRCAVTHHEARQRIVIDIYRKTHK